MIAANENLAIDEKMVESERGVVISERSTGLENSNFRSIWDEVKGEEIVSPEFAEKVSILNSESKIQE